MNYYIKGLTALRIKFGKVSVKDKYKSTLINTFNKSNMLSYIESIFTKIISN